METTERRIELLKVLCRRRHDTIENLAFNFNVSTRTIRRDIEYLSRSYPLYTQAGRYGGVYIMDGYTLDRMYMNDQELSVLKKLADALNQHPILNSDEIQIFQSIISHYSKPTIKKGKNNESK